MLLTLLVMLGLAGLVISSHLYLRRVQEAALGEHVEVIADGLMQTFEERIDSRLTVVESLSQEVVYGTLSTGDTFVQRVTLLQERFPDYLAINYISPEGIIEQVVPVEPNRAALGRQVADHPEAGTYFTAAQASGKPQLTHALTLFQGGMGFASYFPISGGAGGTINGVFRVVPMVEHLLDPSLHEDLRMVVFIGDTEAYTVGAEEVLPGPSVSRSETLWGQEWRLEVYPSPLLYSKYHHWSGDVILVFGLLGAMTGGLLFYNRQVSRRRRQLQRADSEQRRSLETLGQLSRNIAHDFNNMLMIQQGIIELNLFEEISDPLREDLLTLQQTCTQGSALARQLLDFAHNSTARQTHFGVDRMLQSCNLLLNRLLPPGVTLRAKLAAGDAELYGDPSVLQQAIFNLVLNARDALPDGGTVTVRSQIIPGAVTIEVEDDGTGIDARHLKRIFTPFFTTKERGTGIGLTVVQKSASDFCGTLSAESHPGQGTCFRLTLPLHSVPTAAIS